MITIRIQSIVVFFFYHGLEKSRLIHLTQVCRAVRLQGSYKGRFTEMANDPYKHCLLWHALDYMIRGPLQGAVGTFYFTFHQALPVYDKLHHFVVPYACQAAQIFPLIIRQQLMARGEDSLC